MFGWLREAYREHTVTTGLGLAAVAAALTLVPACTVGPDYVKPKTGTPAAYKENAGWKVAEPQDHIVRGAWWEIYNDPLLNELEKQVDISNQNIALAEAQYRQARWTVQASRAAYFPTLTATASASRSKRSANAGSVSSAAAASGSGSSSTIGSAAGIAGAPVNDFSLPFDASWEPDLWGRIRRTVEGSRANFQASAADLESARLSARTSLAQDYFQLRALDSQKKLYEDTIAAFEKNFQLTKNRYARGVASKNDVLLAETQLKTTRAQAIDLDVQRGQLEHAIALLLGKPASEFSIPFACLEASAPSIPAGLPSELLERRPDVAGAERRVAAANAQIGVAIAAYFPTLTLTASGGFEASDWAKWLSWPSRFWAIGSALAETVLDGGLRKAQTEQARAAHAASVATYRQTVLTGFQEVEDNLLALRVLEKEALAQDEAVAASKQSLAFSLNQYKAGLLNYLDVIVVQAAALNNERTAIGILGRRLTSSVLLVKALGGGWTASDLPSTEP